jgi:polyhydroxybutyrate depolymerase
MQMMPKLIYLILALILAGCSSSSSSPDPAQQPLASGTRTVSVDVDGVQRQYILHVPEGWQDKPSLPVVLMFHGGGGTARGAIRETGWIEMADDQGFLVVFPEGMPPNPALPSSFSGNPQRWNDGSDRFNLDVDDVAFVQKIIEDLDADFSMDANRIFATGFSNGASMAFRVGVELSGAFAAIGPIAGALWLDGFTLDEPVSLIYITGTEDTLNPLDGGQPRLVSGEILNEKEKPPVQAHMDKWSGALGCDETPFPLATIPGILGESYANCLDPADIVYYRIEGMGHTWPGGVSLLPETVVGKTSDLMDATQTLWDFFQDHPKP